MNNSTHKERCLGLHCRCMNIGGVCPNHHYADCKDHNPALTAPANSEGEVKEIRNDTGDLIGMEETRIMTREDAQSIWPDAKLPPLGDSGEGWVTDLEENYSVYANQQVTGYVVPIDDATNFIRRLLSSSLQAERERIRNIIVLSKPTLQTEEELAYRERLLKQIDSL